MENIVNAMLIRAYVLANHEFFSNHGKVLSMPIHDLEARVEAFTRFEYFLDKNGFAEDLDLATMEFNIQTRQPTWSVKNEGDVLIVTRGKGKTVRVSYGVDPTCEFKGERVLLFNGTFWANSGINLP